MAITRITSKKKRPGWTYDSKEKFWYSYRIDVRAGGKRHRPCFSTRSEAEDAIAELKTKERNRRHGISVGAPPLMRGAPTVRMLFERRQKQIKNSAEKKRAERIFAYFEDLLAHSGSGASTPISQVSKADFQKFNNARLAEGVKPATVNRDLTVLIYPFRHAAEIFPDELADYEPPPLPRPKYKKSKGRLRVIEENEMRQIVASILRQKLPREHETRLRSRPIGALMFELAWLLGLRLGEVIKLEKTDFNIERGTLRVVRWKTGEVTLFEFLPARVREILRQGAELSKNEFIFSLSCSLNTFYDILKQACEANNLKYGREYLDGITFHSTRHSFTTRLIRVTDIATAQSYTGHSTPEMLGYYGHASTDTRRAAMEALYGEKNGIDETKLKEIWTAVRDGRMDFSAFVQTLKILANGQKAAVKF